MRPVRFVALSEDGQALVLADEVGRLLTLPIDDRVSAMLRPDRASAPRESQTSEEPPSLAPRDIQARIRSGESAEDVARIAGVPVDRVLRYAGPVLQERAMLAQHARRTRLKTSDKGQTLADVVDARLMEHGVDMEKISWDAYRRDDGTWRVVATWPSGKASATAVWELDKARQLIAPQDDMARFLCGAAAQEAHRGHEVAPPRPDRGGHEPMYQPGREPARPGRDPMRGGDPIRTGRDALMASLERPLGTPTRGLEPNVAPAASAASAAATGEVPRRRPSARAFYVEERDHTEAPSVPSLAVLRPRRTDPSAPVTGERPVKRGPSWDDVLFGSAPAAKDA